MNIKMVLYVLGFILKIEGGLLVLPLIVAIYYREDTIIAFIITILLLFIFAYVISYKKPNNKVIHAKEGFIIVSLSWLILSLFGALPFYISGEIPRFIDALFESVSGFTTTGASIILDVESISKSLLFWRSFSQWIGGMGVLVFVISIVPLAGGRTMYIMQAEVAGPTVDKLVPKIQKTTKILYKIYMALTIILILLLLVGGMPLFDSILHGFSTAATGGFGIKASSVAYYNSPFIDIVLTIFMILFSINFNLYYLILSGNILRALKSEEMKNFLIIVALSVLVIAINIMPNYNNFFQALRYSSFQVSSVISTSGFSTADFNQWPMFSKAILFLLMLIGGCAGSTAGGIKVSRITILFKSIKQHMKKLIYPRYIESVRFEDKPIKQSTLKGVHLYISVYFIIYFLSILLVSIDNLDFETSITAVTTCLNSVGPGFGKVGPAGNFKGFSNFSKIVLSMDMLFGRLEIFPILMLFQPSLWRKKSQRIKPTFYMRI